MNTVMSQEINAFGEIPLKRESEIKNKTSKSNHFYSIEFQGKYQDIPEIEVRVEFPIYRLANGRTRTYQREYLALHPDCPENLFFLDENSFDAQFAQHEILLKLAEEASLFKTFSTENMSQTEPLICTNDGVVVNGNRRLCAWRELYYQDKEKYKRFQFVRIAVLPDCDVAAIEELESRLQLQNPMRAEYRWHTIALLAEERIAAGQKESEVAKSVGESTASLRNLIEARDYAEEYLTRIGKKDQWSLIDSEYNAFEQMVKGRKKLTSQGDKELFEAICFKCITEGSRGGRLYKFIPDVADNLQQIAEQLKIAIPVTTPQKESTESNTAQNTSDIDLLSGEESINVEETSRLAVAVENDNEIGQVQDIAIEVIEEQKQIEKEKKSKNYMLDQLSKAVSALQNAIGAIQDDANTTGLEEQLNAVDEKVKVLREWLDEG